jgi:hypothetical protein
LRVQSGNYWSSTSYADNATYPAASYAWFVYLDNSGLPPGAINKTVSHYAWPVRGGQ